MMRSGIQAVVEGKDLTEAEAMQVMTEIMEGAATPAQVAAFLIGLRGARASPKSPAARG